MLQKHSVPWIVCRTLNNKKCKEKNWNEKNKNLKVKEVTQETKEDRLQCHSFNSKKLNDRFKIE